MFVEWIPVAYFVSNMNGIFAGADDVGFAERTVGDEADPEDAVACEGLLSINRAGGFQ